MRRKEILDRWNSEGFAINEDSKLLSLEEIEKELKKLGVEKIEHIPENDKVDIKKPE